MRLAATVRRQQRLARLIAGDSGVGEVVRAVGEDEVDSNQGEEGRPERVSALVDGALDGGDRPPRSSGALLIMIVACGVVTRAPPTTMSAVVAKTTGRDVSRSNVLSTIRPANMTTSPLINTVRVPRRLATGPAEKAATAAIAVAGISRKPNTSCDSLRMVTR